MSGLIKVLDWISRLMTAQELLKHISHAVATVLTAEQNYLESVVQSYVARGYSRKRAEVYACWELGYIETDPETVCRLGRIE
jgi:hypothetical protein